MMIPHILTYILTLTRNPGPTWVRHQFYLFYWMLKGEEPRTPTPAYQWDTTLKPTFEPEWLNSTTYNRTAWNRTHFHNGTIMRTNYFKYDCKGRPWIQLRFSCFWRGFEKDCYGHRLKNRLTRKYCPKECGKCPPMFLKDFIDEPLEGGDDRNGKGLQDLTNPCQGARLLQVDPINAGDIYLSTQKVRWKEAYFCCKINGLRLLDEIGPETMGKMKRFFQGGRKNVTWLRSTDAVMENNWVWPSKKVIKRHIFMKFEPNNDHYNQNCGSVFMHKKKFRLDDRNCDDKLRFICKQIGISRTGHLRRQDVPERIVTAS